MCDDGDGGLHGGFFILAWLNMKSGRGEKRSEERKRVKKKVILCSHACMARLKLSTAHKTAKPSYTKHYNSEEEEKIQFF